MLRNEQHLQKILQRFPTEKYKQFSHQTRPFFTMATGFFLLALGWLHIVNFAVISWLLAAFVLDNVALTPIMSALRAINHLANGRKKTKSIVILIVVALALCLGSGLGYYLLAQYPFIATLFSNYIGLTGCSPFLISMGAILGGYFSHATHKVSLFWGIFIGSCLGSVAYIPIPIALEVIYFSAVATAFFATVIAKQSLRLYYKLTYGHSNADGYNMDRNPMEQRQFIIEQAQKFEVSPQAVAMLAEHCQKRIAEVKKDASFWDEYMGYRSQITNSYKDIRLGLLNPTASSEEISETKYLVANSHLPPAFNTPENKQKVSAMFRSGTLFAPDLELRMWAHQFKISESGLMDVRLLSPFQASP